MIILRSKYFSIKEEENYMLNLRILDYQLLIAFCCLFIANSAFAFDVFEAKGISTKVDIKVEALADQV